MRAVRWSKGKVSTTTQRIHRLQLPMSYVTITLYQNVLGRQIRYQLAHNCTLKNILITECVVISDYQMWLTGVDRKCVRLP